MNFYESTSFLAQSELLTHKQLAALSWIAESKSFAEAAIILGCSPSTVKGHLMRCAIKLESGPTPLDICLRAQELGVLRHKARMTA